MLLHREKKEQAVPKTAIYAKLKELEEAYYRREMTQEEYQDRREALLEKLG